MSVHYIYYLAGWNFVVDLLKKNNALLSLLLKILLLYEDDFCCNKHAFGKLICTLHQCYAIVVIKFVKSSMSLMLLLCVLVFSVYISVSLSVFYHVVLSAWHDK